MVSICSVDFEGNLVEHVSSYIIPLCAVAAMAPPYAVAADVPQDVLEKEKKFLTEQALESGKPLEIAEKVSVELHNALKSICHLAWTLTTICIV